MVDYLPLLTRAVARLPSTSPVATRHAIYKRARKAQLTLLRTLGPPLPESAIAREEKALDEAIALVEAKFGGTESAAEPPFAAAADAARTEASIPPLSNLNLAKVVPPSARADKSNSWFWLPLAAVLGALLAVADATNTVRQNSQYHAVDPPEALQEPALQQPAKIAMRPQPLPTEGNSTAPDASVPPGSHPTGQSGAEPANPAPDASSLALPGTARAAMLIASNDPQHPVVILGSTVWSTIPPVPGHPATVALKADADIPVLKMHATMILRKNTDPTLQATHTIDLKFSFAEGAPITGVKNVEPKMRNLGSTASEALTSAKLKISDFYFVIALANGDPDRAHNLDLMQTRAWFEFPLLLNDNRIAKLLFQKSSEAEAMLAKAFEAWND
jgi:hypothetical protein